MIIIKPDLVIKWANSNLVLHRVREHLCVFPVSPHIFTFLNILVMVLVSLNIYMRCACVCVCVSVESAAEEMHILKVFVWAWRLLSSFFLQREKKKTKKTHTQTFPHPFFLYLALTLFSSLPLSFCITYKGSRFLQNEATYGRYANEIIARGLEWDTIYPKSWLSIMAGD